MSKKDLLSLINQALQPVTKTLGNLKTEVEGLRKELKEKDAQIQVLSDKLDEREQYSRRNNLRIFGVKEEEGEKTDELVKQVGAQLGLNISQFQIDRSHRVGRRGTGDKPRPILVKFYGYGPRHEMFTSKKKLKGTKVTIREDLTSQRLDVLNKAIEAYTFRKVWTHDGTILINAGDARPSRVKYTADLEDIIKRFPPGN